MKLATSTLLIGSAVAFAPSLTCRSATSLAIGREGNVELGGNTWKPDRLVIEFQNGSGGNAGYTRGIPT